MDFQNLNESQIEAVKTLNGPILCLAGAGSGKTTTLTYRVANLIENKITPSSILLLTFTKKAAKDMIVRINSLIGPNAQFVERGTFHHFATQIINRFHEYIKINSNYTVIDDNDSIDIIQSLKNSINKDNNSIALSKNIIFQIFSKSRNFSKSIKEIIDNFYSYNIDYNILEKLFKLYTEFKYENNLLDYDDLLENLYKLLVIPEINKLLSEQYQYIMVDEYQDTNKLEAKIIYLLANKHKNIMVVGDDAQSIYSFRGSRIENILEFSNVFPNCKIIKLEKNYRSDGYILKACNSLIQNSKKCLKKTLYTDKSDKNKIILVKCISELEEATLITHRIIDLYKMGYSLNDMAILFRNSNYSYELESELNKRLIPYRKSGGKKLLDSDHIRNIICYLRILNNPYDKISWIKVLTLIRGIGFQTANNIFEYIKNQKEPYDLTNYKINKEMKSSLVSLTELLLKSINFINKKPIFLLNLVIDFYINNIKAIYPNNVNLIIKQLDQLTLLCEKYSTLHDVLSDIYLDEKSNDLSNIKDESNQDLLTLSTIHSAKGLEWKHVFIINATDGRLPSFNNTKNYDDLEEERRLMYVAMTRAMESLMITYPIGIYDKFSREVLTKPSRFINNIDSKTIEVWQIKH